MDERAGCLMLMSDALRHLEGGDRTRAALDALDRLAIQLEEVEKDVFPPASAERVRSVRAIVDANPIAAHDQLLQIVCSWPLSILPV